MKKQGLFTLARESEAALAPEGVEPEAITDGEFDSVVDFAVDGGNTGEIDSINTDIEIAEDGIAQGERLEAAVGDIRDKLSEAADQGGMSEPAAGAVAASLEALRIALGGDPEEKKEMSFEGFRDRENRVEATRTLVLEADSFLGKIGESLAAVVRSLIEKIIAFAKAAFSDAERQRQRAGQLAKVAVAVGNTEMPAETPIEDDHLARVLSVGGWAPTPGKFTQAYAKFAQGNTSLDLVKQTEKAQHLTGVTLTLITKIKDTQSDAFDAGLEGVRSVINTMAEGNSSVDLVFGGKKLLMAAEDGKITASLQGESKADGQLMVLSGRECKDLAQLAGDHLGGWAKAQSGVKALTGKLNELNRALGVAIQGVGAAGGEGGPIQQRLGALREVVRAIQIFCMVAIKQVQEYELSVTKATLSYIGKSLQALRGAQKANAGQQSQSRELAAA